MSHSQNSSFHSDANHSQDDHSSANHGHDAHHHGNTDSVSKRCLFIITLIGTAYTMVFLFENWPSGDAKVIKTPTLTLSSGERLLATSARFVTLLRNLDKWYSDEINVDHHDHDNLCKCVCDHEQGHEHDHDHESDHEKKPAQSIKSGSGKSELSEDMKKAPPVTQPIKVLKPDQKVGLNETDAKIAKEEKKMKEKKVTEEVKEEKKKKKDKKEEKKDGAAKAA